MNIHIRAAQLNAQEVQLSEILTVQEIRLSATDIDLRAEPGGAIRIANADATLLITEAGLNRFFDGRDFGTISDLKIVTLTGKVRISGRYSVIPFTFTAVPEIDGGARLRLDPRQFSVIGAPLPGIGAHMIGEKINVELAKQFDTTRLPLPLRLTGLTVEPGRLLLTASASIELRSMPTASSSQDIVR